MFLQNGSQVFISSTDRGRYGALDNLRVDLKAFYNINWWIWGAAVRDGREGEERESKFLLLV